MTNDQELMWKMLANDAAFLCHKWGSEMSKLKGKKFHQAADNHLKFVVDNFGLEEGSRILSTWLRHYELPIDITKLSSFEDFHSKYGSYISYRVNNHLGIRDYE